MVKVNIMVNILYRELNYYDQKIEINLCVLDYRSLPDFKSNPYSTNPNSVNYEVILGLGVMNLNRDLITGLIWSRVMTYYD